MDWNTWLMDEGLRKCVFCNTYGEDDAIGSPGQGFDNYYCIDDPICLLQELLFRANASLVKLTKTIITVNKGDADQIMDFCDTEMHKKEERALIWCGAHKIEDGVYSELIDTLF